jgi:subtilisin family serine protease
MSGTSMAAPHVAALLALGNVGSDGLACGDPDGDPDPIAHR